MILRRSLGSERRCGHPAVPANARVSLSGATADASGATAAVSVPAGVIATYECDEGYELFGAKTRECTLRGDWTQEPPFCGTNVAFRKPANQSTTVRGGQASNGNDGERTTEHDGKRCTETQREASPWWQVDLLRHYAVKVVRVTTRGCCGHQPLQDLEIRVGNSSSDLQRNPLCAWFPGTIGVGRAFAFPERTAGVGASRTSRQRAVCGARASRCQAPRVRCVNTAQTPRLRRVPRAFGHPCPPHTFPPAAERTWNAT
ncbi:sushi repeat (SCR repeat) domain-containing protein [Phthorimaea operculella]|nr:sushi repeat (SCR repeat) domain-containing protein [Phthorimaea operculella]